MGYFSPAGMFFRCIFTVVKGPKDGGARCSGIYQLTSFTEIGQSCCVQDVCCSFVIGDLLCVQKQVFVTPHLRLAAAQQQEEQLQRAVEATFFQPKQSICK